jgi:hypothetical protein
LPYKTLHGIERTLGIGRSFRMLINLHVCIPDMQDNHSQVRGQASQFHQAHICCKDWQFGLC